jgi:hypothetical protein
MAGLLVANRLLTERLATYATAAKRFIYLFIQFAKEESL